MSDITNFFSEILKNISWIETVFTWWWIPHIISITLLTVIVYYV